MAENEQQNRAIARTTVNLGEALATQPLQVNLPLMPGSIADGNIRQACYQLIAREVQNLVAKWGFVNYALYMDWPDADNQAPLSFISVDMGHFKGYLAMMLMQMAGKPAGTKIQFLKEFAKVINSFGMLEQFKLFLEQESAGQQAPPARPPFAVDDDE